MIANAFPTPQQIITDLPSSSIIDAAVKAHSRAIKHCLTGNRKIIILGPCSIHNAEEALELAAKIKTLQQSTTALLIMRTYFEKPRSTIGWKGFLHDPDINGADDMEKGIRAARQLLLDIATLNVPCATETLNPLVPAYLLDLVSWTCIGARTAESQTHREIASSLSIPVGFKNSTDGNLDIAINAMQSAQAPHVFLGVNDEGKIAQITSDGNQNCHLILRGGNRPNYDSASVAAAVNALRAANLPEAIIIDCSHGNSGKDHTKQAIVFRNVVEQMKTNDAIKGLMLEVNLLPGKQAPSSNAGYGVSITDACIGWDEAQQLILEVQRGDRMRA